MVSSNASLSFEEIAKARVSPDQVIFFQLYKNKDNAVAAERIREVERLGYKAIFLTVDAPITGNRERDVRSSWELDEINAIGQSGQADKPLTQAQIDMEEDMDTDTSGTAGGFLVNDDIDMTWEEVRLSVLVCNPSPKRLPADHPMAAQRHEASDCPQGHPVCRGKRNTLRMCFPIPDKCCDRTPCWPLRQAWMELWCPIMAVSAQNGNHISSFR